MARSKINLPDLLDLITIDRVTNAIKEGWLVSWTIARGIVGPDIWNKLEEDEKGIIVDKVNQIKKENSIQN